MSMLQLCMVCYQIVSAVNRNQFSQRQFGGFKLSIVKIFTDHLAVSFKFVVFILQITWQLVIYFIVFLLCIVFCFNYRFIVATFHKKL